ncbi:hypothetical protein E5676_scaffold195G00210 [Cucumis melo var. makuwa]|uniref:Uncharacterized protein n=2 Tax=Cucumis melo TaxID=3656 RepID=A0A5D3DG78_CUCMM|nr:hypothetical protein [Cucumis melo subsp. melo]KAA0025863.1 hypothetical protein E6C27_scaffold34G001410 [Cucumis melo var. makuwa]TYK22602.1 hypothetical protein E5676_scaffold195G00210 [Cucumis melo var. makuwa]
MKPCHPSLYRPSKPSISSRFRVSLSFVQALPSNVVTRTNLFCSHRRTSGQSQFFSILRTSVEPSSTNQQPECKQVVGYVRKPSKPYVSSHLSSESCACESSRSLQAKRLSCPIYESFPLQPSRLADLLSSHAIF